jgi:hypothetical protein
MHQERKRIRTLRVIRMYEPDRMAPANLQFAYEQVVSSDQYRILTPKPKSEELEKILHITEEVSA